MLTDLNEKELQLLVAAAYFCGASAPKPDNKKVQQEMSLASTGAVNMALSRAKAKLFKGRDGDAGIESPKKATPGRKRKDAGDGEATPKAKRARGKKARDEEIQEDGHAIKAEKNESEDDEV